MFLKRLLMPWLVERLSVLFRLQESRIFIFSNQVMKNTFLKGRGYTVAVGNYKSLILAHNIHACKPTHGYIFGVASTSQFYF